ncbi:uncharacterized protein LOC119104828 [Pollicipes pollicipes]|uniref:uncharacterized protein LOC119104828 n=1 Tax=Pollicipes pollicipes TaxID=41117 RepID=UPI001884CC5F|nr:uncharacterized protein LOC119104828 [Pollicipes pollicipes]XP_037084447.1 uncharacterized protein LOC119104828 [Pollicipes pollicipes]
MTSCQQLSNGMDHPTIEYTKLSHDRLDEALDLMVSCFFTREPTFSVLSGLAGGAPEDHRLWLSASLPEWHWDASWLALDVGTGCVIGASMCGVYGVDERDPYWRLYETGSEAARVYGSFMDEVGHSFDAFKSLNVPTVSENLLLAVDPRYGGLGVGSELCRRTSVEGAVRSGAPVSLCFCTSSTTQRIYERLGFEVGCETDYAGSALERAVDVASILPHRACRVMYKRLGRASTSSS